eukprot:1227381-Amphidinium_carterae.1
MGPHPMSVQRVCLASSGGSRRKIPRAVLISAQLDLKAFMLHQRGASNRQDDECDWSMSGAASV